MVLARDVVGFETRGPVRAVLLDGSTDIEARAVLVASGVSYRRLEAPGIDDAVGRGVYYGAHRERGEPDHRSRTCTSWAAANSAGQAALNFARFARGSSSSSGARPSRHRCRSTSSAASTPRPTSTYDSGTEVVGARGDGHLEAIVLADRGTGAEEEVETSWVFVFIGAAPRTGWLGDTVARDGRGFVLTGPDLPAGAGIGWSLDRTPYALETSVPGVFAAGDVRLDSMKRVASAVGEGAMSVHLVHRYLAST